MNILILTCMVIVFHNFENSCILAFKVEILNRFARESYPYQIVIFSNNKSCRNATFQDFIFHAIPFEVPRILIDYADIKYSGDNRSLRLPVLQNPRSSTLYVIVENDDKDGAYSKRTFDMLNLFVEFSPLPSKPKCLMIFLSENTLLDNTLRNILLRAWALKFLDFSIIKFNSDYGAVVYNYNPFTRSCSVNDFKERVDIFPDKLQNMNGYPIKLAVYNDSYFLNVKQNSENQTEVEGISYPFFDIFSRKLNFTMTFSIYKPYNYSSLLDNLFKKLENNEIHAIPITMMSNTFLYGNNHGIGRAIVESKLVMIVPILPVSKVRIAPVILVYLFIFIIMKFILTVAVLFLKLPPKNWQMLNLFGMLLGMNSQYRPQKLVEKIIFLTVAFLSMKYSSDILVKLVSYVDLVSEEQPFNTFEDIIESKLPIYGMKLMIEKIEELPQAIKSKILYKASAFDCVKIVNENKSAICIAPCVMAKLLVEMYGRRNGIPIMKIAGPTFNQDYAAFPFERSSPFMERIDSITQRILESGMKESWKYMQKSIKNLQKGDEFTSIKNQGILVILLSLILLHMCATVVFIFEILIVKIFNGKYK